MLNCFFLVSFCNEQEDVAFFSFPFNFEAFYMCEKESEGKGGNDHKIFCVEHRLLFSLNFYMRIYL